MRTRILAATGAGLLLVLAVGVTWVVADDGVGREQVDAAEREGRALGEGRAGATNARQEQALRSELTETRAIAARTAGELAVARTELDGAQGSVTRAEAAAVAAVEEVRNARGELVEARSESASARSTAEEQRQRADDAEDRVEALEAEITEAQESSFEEGFREGEAQGREDAVTELHDDPALFIAEAECVLLDRDGGCVAADELGRYITLRIEEYEDELARAARSAGPPLSLDLRRTAVGIAVCSFSDLLCPFAGAIADFVIDFLATSEVRANDVRLRGHSEASRNDRDDRPIAVM